MHLNHRKKMATHLTVTSRKFQVANELQRLQVNRPIIGPQNPTDLSHSMQDGLVMNMQSLGTITVPNTITGTVRLDTQLAAQ